MTTWAWMWNLTTSFASLRQLIPSMVPPEAVVEAGARSSALTITTPSGPTWAAGERDDSHAVPALASARTIKMTKGIIARLLKLVRRSDVLILLQGSIIRF